MTGEDPVRRSEKQVEFQEAKEQVSAILQGGRILGELKIIGGLLADVNAEDILGLAGSPLVKRVELDGTASIVDDVALNEIGAEEVWTLLDSNNDPLTGMGIRIAIIDTGVDYTHPDLGGCFGPGCKVIGGWNFVFNGSDPMDDNGHGTHVAATAAGKGLVNGVAPDAKILAYKVCDSSGVCSWSAIISAIDYATDPDRDGNPSDHVDVASMSLGGKGPMFNAISSIPIESILRRPTVIELKDIPNNEEKAFVTALILMNLMEYIETKGRSKQLRHLTLVEEAHRLLPNLSTQKGDPESADPRRRMVEQFANMLAEVRAYGEGLAIVEQIPTKIIPDAIKNTATKIAHRVPAADDREVLAGAMNVTPEQATAFAALQPGEAIISVERHPIPIKIQVPNTIDRIGLPIGEIGGDEVKRHMTEFYLRNPLPRAPQSPLVADLLLIVESRWFKVGFQEAYLNWLATGAEEPLANLLLQSARKNSKSDEDVLPYASRILSLAAERYLLFEEEKEVFPSAFMRSVERWMRNDRN